MKEVEESHPAWVMKARLLIACALLLAAAAVAYRFARLVVSSPPGELARYVPANVDCFIQVQGLSQMMHRLNSSPSGALARQVLLGRDAGSIWAPLRQKLWSLRRRFPFALERETLSLGFGKDAALALTFGHETTPLHWLVLTRSSFGAIKADSLELPGWRKETFTKDGLNVLTFNRDVDTIIVSSSGDLVLVSNDALLAGRTIQLLTGRGSIEESFAGHERPQAAEQGPTGPKVNLYINLKQVLHEPGEAELSPEEREARILSRFKGKLKALSLPGELVGLGTIFMADKVGVLGKAEAVHLVSVGLGSYGRASVVLSHGMVPPPAATGFSFLNLVPPDIGYFSVENLDFLEWFRQLVRKESQDRAAIEREISDYCQFLGIQDFEKGFLNQLGPQACIVLASPPPAVKLWKYPLPALAFLAELKSPEHFAGFLRKSVARAMEDMRAQHALLQTGLPGQQRKPFPFIVQEEDEGGIHFFRLDMEENYLGRAFSPAYAVVGNALVISSSQHLLESIIQLYHRAGKNSLSFRNSVVETFGKPDAMIDGFWYISPPHLAEALSPLASSYIETHREWSPEEKDSLFQRIKEFNAFAANFDSLTFTTRQQTDRLVVEWKVTGSNN